MTLALELLFWEVIGVGVWMASLSAFSAHELVVACGCAVPAAVAATGARRALRGAWRLPVDAFRWVAMWPGAIVADAGRVLTLPLRDRGGGRLRTVDFAAPGTGSGPAGRRAAAIVALSATPATVVVATDEEAGTALVHAVGPVSRLERALAGRRQAK